MVRLNPTKITSYLSDTASRVAKSASKSAEELTREMEMVPRYLEVAQLATGEYRFNPEDIKVLRKAFGDFDTALCKSDVVKELLSIGLQKGKPLSIKEMTAFLKATSSMEPREQQNVLKFIKGLKEVETVKYDEAFVKKNFISFEDYKAKSLESYPEYYARMTPDELERHFRDSYKAHFDSEIRMVRTSDYYRKIHEKGPMDVTTIIGVPGYNFVEGISKCSNPEVLSEIVMNLGPERFQRIKFVEQSLVDAYKLSGGNMSFVNDLLRGFYPAETKAIVKALKEDPSKAEVLLKTYREHTSENPTVFDGNLSTQRRAILKKLKLDGKIEMLPLNVKEDVFGPAVEWGKKTRIISGNYEGGKRRR